MAENKREDLGFFHPYKCVTRISVLFFKTPGKTIDYKAIYRGEITPLITGVVTPINGVGFHPL